MKSIVCQNGHVLVSEIEKPEMKDNYVLVKTHYSGISPGTELMQINKKLNKKTHLGYSASGVVEAVGEGVSHLKKGDKVACYGAPYVKHSEYLLVPKNLAAPVPDHVNLKEAAFTGLGAIAIHSLRQADLRFGEHIVVVGLGILGQIIAQISDAASFRLIGYDLLQKRCNQLQNAGIGTVVNDQNTLEEKVMEQTNEQGADTVLLCANGKQDEIIDQALNMIRDRGQIVIVGDLEMNFSRELFFKKEANISISRAGGPGRYDTSYERDNIDYPLGYVRWTEGRNIIEYIRLLSEGRINISPLLSKIIPINDAPDAYDLFKKDQENTLGVLIDFTN